MCSAFYNDDLSYFRVCIDCLKGGEQCDEQWKRAMDYVSQVSELNYMAQVVIMLYECIDSHTINSF